MGATPTREGHSSSIEMKGGEEGGIYRRKLGKGRGPSIKSLCS